MNDEPVAWMFKHKKVVDFNKPNVDDDNWIPLYTHSADLTDDVAKHHYNKGHEDGRKIATIKTLTDEEMYELLEKYQGIELCKAVLRKAQEK